MRRVSIPTFQFIVDVRILLLTFHGQIFGVHQVAGQFFTVAAVHDLARVHGIVYKIEKNEYRKLDELCQIQLSKQKSKERWNDSYQKDPPVSK
jgi:gamma-glutamylcyclotransferase (GGCT)/AIG2-like uncharacterized protein YtfP